VRSGDLARQAGHRGSAINLLDLPPNVAPAFVPSGHGVDIALHHLGGPDEPEAPVLLFAHATGFHGLVWRPMATYLAGRYRCLALDFRGHGMSVTPPGASLAWAHMGDDAVAALDAVDSDQEVHGIAHSMGGAALVLAAFRRPGRFRSLWLYEPVIVPPGGLLSSDGPNPLAEGAARRRSHFDSYEQAIANFESKPPLNQLHPDALRAYVHEGFSLQHDGTVELRCRPATEAAVYRGAARSGAWGVLSHLELPVAVVAGSPEEFGPAAFAPRVAAALPGGVSVGRALLGHFGPLADPRSMADDVVSWVEAHR
jgi:pimeloyl-ACP methyl ester carboxylesterase